MYTIATGNFSFLPCQNLFKISGFTPSFCSGGVDTFLCSDMTSVILEFFSCTLFFFFLLYSNIRMKSKEVCSHQLILINLYRCLTVHLLTPDFLPPDTTFSKEDAYRMERRKSPWLENIDVTYSPNESYSSKKTT